jgi:hypothetical protein
MPSFNCDDPYGYSGVASCTVIEGSSPLDTTPGRHTFTVAATDVAGNTTTKSVEYLVGAGACVTPPPVPGNLKGWWKFDGNFHDSIRNRDAMWNAGAGTFQTAVVNQGWNDGVSGNFLWAWEGSAVLAGQGLTVAVWVHPYGMYGESGTIVSNPLQYRIARYPDGTLRWAFNRGSGFVNSDSFASLSGTLSCSTIATPSSPVGVYAVTPLGLSSANYTIAFVSGSLTIARAATITLVAATPNPSGFNQAATLTATVAPAAPGAGSPSGSVQFFDGSTLLGTAPLSGGTAALTTNGFAAGSHAISATCSGDASFAGSSGTGELTVNPASSSSTTTVTSSANPATAGQTVTWTATVTAPGSPGGSVEFYDGGALLGTVVLSGTTARYITSALASGGHAITAIYLGNGAIPPSTSPAFAQYVQLSGAKSRGSTVALAASPSSATLGSSVTLTATATGSSRQAPTGQVTFMLNGTVLGQGTLGSTGTVTAATALSTSSLPHGTHTIAAVYLGDAHVPGEYDIDHAGGELGWTEEVVDMD